MIWTPRLITRVVAIVAFVAGVLCLPVGLGGGPKRRTSLFFNFADFGVYLEAALVLMGVGVVIALLSFLLPKDD
jgi:hypothetical protein